MKIVVNGKVYDGEEQPIMIVLTDADKANIANMFAECSRYAQEPDDIASAALTRILDFEAEEGGPCFSPSCMGFYCFNDVENCECHIMAPCGACIDNPLVCSECGERGLL